MYWFNDPVLADETYKGMKLGIIVPKKASGSTVHDNHAHYELEPIVSP